MYLVRETGSVLLDGLRELEVNWKLVTDLALLFMFHRPFILTYYTVLEEWEHSVPLAVLLL